MFNGHHEALEFTLPSREWGQQWTEVLDTFVGGDELSGERLGTEVAAGGAVLVHPWTLVLLRRLG
jgi:glycogen operon protein